jgi:hypothetical protein
MAAYNAYYKRIAGKLPVDVLAFEKLRLHDEGVKRVQWLEGHVLEVELSAWRLWFFGTARYTSPWATHSDSDLWLYHEIELLDDKYWQLCVVLQDAEKELVIQARHIAVYSKVKEEWVVPPPSPESEVRTKPKRPWARHRKRGKRQ